jgi:hypothetical protein
VQVRPGRVAAVAELAELLADLDSLADLTRTEPPLQVRLLGEHPGPDPHHHIVADEVLGRGQDGGRPA